MCGRFTQYSKIEFIQKILRGEIRIREIPVPDYNIPPTKEVVASRVNLNDNVREVIQLKWGLVPSWAKDEKMAARMINARCETVHEKPSFRSAFKKQRCLIPADGFYEWLKIDGKKQPFYIYRKDKQPFIFAGLWEYNNKFGEPVETCTIITTESNEMMKPIHERMPVIIDEESFDEWLNPSNQCTDGLRGLLKPYDYKKMEMYPISTVVNSHRNNSQELLKQIDIVNQLSPEQQEQMDFLN